MRESETAREMLDKIREQRVLGMDYLFTGNHSQLSPEDQKVVNEAMKAAVDWALKEAITDDNRDLSKLEEEGLNAHHVENIEVFKNEVKGTYEKYSEQDPLTAEFVKEVHKNQGGNGIYQPLKRSYH
ncbi:hypothetical protein BTO30_11480 [Domibacillus antri]|uniref:Uncharacterized protein n=1 Tax=Domibacillus antri TaxID=1714264 RepID=A0A1Q8Q420_9BACI|nr:hypothetical protein [Domibacillus antri]OLN22106.1 hypothetical protein BTO30_11480 [Domibacillus antri]